MKEKIILIIVFAFLFLAAGGLYFLNSKNSKNHQNQTIINAVSKEAPAALSGRWNLLPVGAHK